MYGLAQACSSLAFSGVQQYADAAISAKATISRIMIMWSLISAAMMFASTPTQFYVLRFLLGGGRGGLLPRHDFVHDVLVPSYRRARMVALFMCAIPVSRAFWAVHCLAASWS